MELWKKTFYDSDEYIQLVFDSYFKAENVIYHIDGDRLVAMMLCIPYDFRAATAADDSLMLRGVYLCGLATLPEYRRRGIMSNLMREAERLWSCRGKDFLFLIPADNGLREYYARMGYSTCSFRRYRNIEFSGNIPNLHFHSLLPWIRSEKTFVDDLALNCSLIESTLPDKGIIHSAGDMMTVIKENENAFLVAYDSFDPKNPNIKDVAALVFPDTKIGTVDANVIIYGWFLFSFKTDAEGHAEGKTEILSAIASAFPRSKVTLIESGGNIDTVGGNPYAMAKMICNCSSSPIGENINLKSEYHNLNISLMLD